MSEDPDVSLLWTSVRERWNEDAAHQFFIEHCRQASRLNQAAALYRALRDDPELGAEARKRLTAITIVAMAELGTVRARPKRNPTLVVNLVLGIVCVLLIYLFIQEWRR